MKQPIAALIVVILLPAEVRKAVRRTIATAALPRLHVVVFQTEAVVVHVRRQAEAHRVRAVVIVVAEEDNDMDKQKLKI